MDKINIDQLAAEIVEALSEYTENVIQNIDISRTKIAKEAVRMLNVTSPKLSGKYAHSWSSKSEDPGNPSAKRIIYAKDPHYRLTHLLEHGHAKADGGRVEAVPHIADAEKWVIYEFEKEVKEAIKNG